MDNILHGFDTLEFQKPQTSTNPYLTNMKSKQQKPIFYPPKIQS
jgi:hypothetical protein